MRWSDWTMIESTVLPLGVEVLVKGAAVAVLGLIVVRALRGSSAALRHLAHSCVLALLVLLPATSATLPQLVVEWTRPGTGASPGIVHGMADGDDAGMGVAHPAMAGTTAAGESQDPGASAALTVASTAAYAGAGAEPTTAALRERIVARVSVAAASAVPWLAGVWLAVAAALILWIIRDVARIRLVQRYGGRAPSRRVLRATERISHSIGLPRAPRVLRTHGIEVPVTAGILRPVVLLPENCREWTDERLSAVLLHELHHIRRRDAVWHLLGEISVALHWPNPFVWRLRRSARAALEGACDDSVLRSGVPAPDYASHLVAMARQLIGPRLPARALAMAHPGGLNERVHAILVRDADRRPVPGIRLVIAFGLVFVLGLPLGAVEISSARGGDGGSAGESVDGAVTRLTRDWNSAADRGTGFAELARGLTHGSAEVRGVAALRLGQLNDRRTVGPLLRALRDPDAYVRENAALALVGSPRDDVRRAVAGLADDPEPGVRSVTAWVLGELGGPVAARALGRMLEADSDAHTRAMAGGSLSRMPEDGLPVLLSLLRSVDPDTRHRAVMGLTTLADRRSASALGWSMIRDPDPRVREGAARALRRIGAPITLDALFDATRDSDWRVRMHALNAVAELSGNDADERVRATLVEALRDPEHQVRLTAAWILDGR